MAVQREFDVVLYGATGFTGRLVSEYFAERAPALRWAVAGRDAAKLAALQEELGLDVLAVPAIVADAGDSAALRALASRTQVLASAALPSPDLPPN